MFTRLRLVLAVAVLAVPRGPVKAAPAAVPVNSDGGWGEWGAWGPCSQTCGGGLSSQHRVCMRSVCEGESMQYRSCCMEACAVERPTFREQQCLSRGAGSWVLAEQGYDECNLVCVNVSDPSHTLSTYVASGTSCHSGSGSRGVCLQQACAAVGCDGVLGSGKTEDHCLQCLAPGQQAPSCTQLSANFVSPPAVQGAVVVVTFPQGATSVSISHPLRTHQGTLELEGVSVESDQFSYQLREEQWHSTQHWTAKGPLTNNVTVQVVNVLQGASVSVNYSYHRLEEPALRPQALPDHTHSPAELEAEEGPMFHWLYEEFSDCSVSCGSGLQTSHATCQDAMYPRQVPDNFCDDVQRPFPISRQCQCIECPPRWEEGVWSACSEACREGVQIRSVQCTGPNGVPVMERECSSALKPPEERPCEAACQAAWEAEEWSECSVQCGHGQQERDVGCVDLLTGRPLDPVQCQSLPQPPPSQPCMLVECMETCYWQLKEWKPCDNSCGGGNRTRRAVCRVARNNHRANETCCDNLPEPVTTEQCHDNRKCLLGPDWQPRAWGQCVGECCQSGTQQRQVECVAISDEGGDQEVLFPESHCLNSTRPASEAACELPGCPQWGVSVWSDCSSSCGEGVHTRNVQCLLGGHELPPSACCGNRPPHNLVCTSNPPCPTTPHPQDCVDDVNVDCAEVVAIGLCEISDSDAFTRIFCCQSCQQHNTHST